MKNDGRPKKPRGKGRPFEKGNKIGVRFGEGQPTNLGGRNKTLISQVQDSLRIYGDASNEMAVISVELAKNQDLEPKERFLFIRDIQDRAMGKPHTNSEDEVKKLREEVKEIKDITLQQMNLIFTGKLEEALKSLYLDGKLKQMIEVWDNEPKS